MKFAQFLATLLLATPSLLAQTAGSLDAAYHPSILRATDYFFGTALSVAGVYAMAVQPDGKTIIAGNFNTVNGASIKGLARLNLNGSVDTGFSASTRQDDYPLCVAIQADGQILIGGSFTNVSGISKSYLARLNPDGTLESTATFNTGTGPNGGVRSIAVQPDGKILLSGGFTKINGKAHNRLARLNADGSVDAGFNATANETPYNIAIQPDGKILLSGPFTTVNSASRKGIARLNPNGTLESAATFNPGTGSDGEIHSVALQPDRKILIAGRFTTFNDQPRNGLARLLANGSLESTATFDAGAGLPGPYPFVQLLLQADGKILVTGYFASVGGVPRSGVARLNPDGSVESTTTFDPGTALGGSNPVSLSAALQPDGKLVLAGYFTEVNGTPCQGMARLLNDAATQDLSALDSMSVQWLRGGAAAEVTSVAFELSTDGGASWTALDIGGRTSGGWLGSGSTLLSSGWLRARGRTTTGFLSSSSGIETAVTAFAAGGKLNAFAATNLTSTSAVLHGSVNPENSSVAVSFDYGLTTAYGASAAGTPSPVTGSTPEAVSASVVGLTPGTLYHFRIHAGTTTGPDLTFATPSDDASLSNLTLSVGTLSPSFAPDRLSFSAPVPNATPEITVTANQAQPGSLIEVQFNGGGFSPATSGAASPILRLNGGSNLLEVKVTARDGATVRTYSVNVVRSVTGAGELDIAYNPIYPAAFSSGATVTAGLPDGKTMVGAGGTSGSSGFYRNLGRLKTDGTLDPGFTPATTYGISHLVARTDGRVLTNFDYLTRVGEYLPDGTQVANIFPEAGESWSPVGVLPDGAILLLFQRAGFVQFARLTAADTAERFAPLAITGNVFCVAVQLDGRILVGGAFTGVGGQSRTNLVRLNADGTLESPATFDPSIAASTGEVTCIAVQGDGKILLAGPIGPAEGARGGRLARLEADGRLESTLATVSLFAGGYAGIGNVALQTDGKILLGGKFDTVNGQERNDLARIDAAGVLDSPASFYFSTDTSFGLRSVEVQADGRILLGLSYGTKINGEQRQNLARLANDAATQSLTVPDASTVQWLRGGASPEVSPVIFEVSIDGGTTWAPLGTGARVAGGWRLTGLHLPASGSVRALGWTTSGPGGRGHGLVEAVTTFSGFPAALTLISPTNGTEPMPSVPVIFTLPAAALPGTVKLTFTGAQTRTLTLAGSQESAGAHALTLDPASPLAPEIASIAGGGNVPDGSYAVTLSFQNAQTSNTEATPAVNVLLDTTAPSITVPVATRFYYPGNLPDFRSLATVTDANATRVTQSPSPQTTISAGTVEVTLTATDAAGNQASRTFQILVRPLGGTSSVLLAQGAPVPGAGTAGGPPADAVIASFGSPAVDDTSSVVFLAKWKSATAGGGSGLFREGAFVAKVGGAVPGLAGATFKTFADPVTDGGHAVCLVTLAGVPAAEAAAALSVTDGGATLLAQSGKIAPGSDGAKFKSFKAAAASPAGAAFLASLVSGTGAPKATAADDTGLWAMDATHPLTLVLREGDVVGGKTLKTLVAFAGGGGSPGQGRGWLTTSTSGATRVLALALFADKTQAVLSADLTGAVTVLSQTGQAGAGGPELADASFASYSFPTTVANGHSAFLATLSTGAGGVTAATARGIFADFGAGTYAPLARVGTSSGTPGGDFIQFKDPVFDANDGLAFSAILKGGPSRAPATESLWWKPPGASLALLAKAGTPAAGLGGGALWRTFPSLATATDRGPIFTATLSGVSAAKASGVWATDFNNELRLLIQASVTQIGGKTVKSFTLLNATVGSTGVTRSFNSKAQVVWLATFTDRTTAIVVTDVP